MGRSLEFDLRNVEPLMGEYLPRIHFTDAARRALNKVRCGGVEVCHLKTIRKGDGSKLTVLMDHLFGHIFKIRTSKDRWFTLIELANERPRWGSLKDERRQASRMWRKVMA